MKGKLTVLMITAFVDMLGLAMVIPLLPFYATKMGASATIVGILIAAFSIAQLASAPLWGRFSDRYGRRPALLAGLLVSAAARSRSFSSHASFRASAAAPLGSSRHTLPTPAIPTTAPRVLAGYRRQRVSARLWDQRLDPGSFTGDITHPELPRRSSA